MKKFSLILLFIIAGLSSQAQEQAAQTPVQTQKEAKPTPLIHWKSQFEGGASIDPFPLPPSLIRDWYLKTGLYLNYDMALMYKKQGLGLSIAYFNFPLNYRYEFLEVRSEITKERSLSLVGMFAGYFNNFKFRSSKWGLSTKVELGFVEGFFPASTINVYINNNFYGTDEIDAGTAFSLAGKANACLNYTFKNEKSIGLFVEQFFTMLDFKLNETDSRTYKQRSLEETFYFLQINLGLRFAFN
jgi:opacity protein-like surface antigen